MDLIFSYQTFQVRYFYDPVGFIENCIEFPIKGGPAPYQLDVADLLITNNRASARGLHGWGKTALASWLTHWFALTRDGIVDWKEITTASVNRQLSKYLWPEIHKWSRKLKWDMIGRNPYSQHELLMMDLKLSTGQAFAVSSTDPQLIEGAHANQIFYLFDESKAISEEVFDAAEGAFASPDVKNGYALAISTPGGRHGRFYSIQSRKPGYEDPGRVL